MLETLASSTIESVCDHTGLTVLIRVCVFDLDRGTDGYLEKTQRHGEAQEDKMVVRCAKQRHRPVCTQITHHTTSTPHAPVSPYVIRQ